VLLKVTSIVSLKISLERDAFCNLQQTAGFNCHHTYHSGIIFWESDDPGIVFPGNVSSGKKTIRESSFRETSFRENNRPGELLSGKRL